MKIFFLAILATGLSFTVGATEPIHLGGQEIKLGECKAFDMPLSDAAWKEAKKIPLAGRAAPLRETDKVKTVKVGIALPKDFDPKKKWPILVVYATSDKTYSSSVNHLREYVPTATDLGWVAVAGDFPPEKEDCDQWRWAAVGTLLDAMHTAWPESKKWPVACAGFSGGAKRSGWFGAIMSKDGYNVIGMWMGGCNADIPTQASRAYTPPPHYKHIPIFLSSGKRDSIATPSAHEAVKASLRQSGFMKVRLESHDGDHSLNQDHIKMGLTWFMDEEKKLKK